MSTEIKTTHSEVEISYHEESNRWKFTLRGRDRSADSLAKAKEAIDKEPTEKKAAFARIEAFKFSGFLDKVDFGVVTSFAERNYRKLEAWFVKEDGDRSKLYADMLYTKTDDNLALLEDWKHATKQRRAWESKCEEIRNKMQTVLAVSGEKEAE